MLKRNLVGCGGLVAAVTSFVLSTELLGDNGASIGWGSAYFWIGLSLFVGEYASRNEPHPEWLPVWAPGLARAAGLLMMATGISIAILSQFL
jgi:hypothetical protein